MNEIDKGREPVHIIVNTRRHTWSQKRITYEEVVAVGYPNEAATEDISFTVRYSRGHDGHGAGTLTAGQSVVVKEGMVFDVVRTSRS